MYTHSLHNYILLWKWWSSSLTHKCQWHCATASYIGRIDPCPKNSPAPGPSQGEVQLHKITSITITITLKYKFQLQLHLHNVILNYNYNYTSIMLYSITITITPCSFQLQLQIFFFSEITPLFMEFLLIDLGCFPDIWYQIMCGTRNHRK